MKIRLFLPLLLVVLVGCNSAKVAGVSDHLLMATLWYQQSDEMKTLYLQEYDRAAKLLRQNLENTAFSRPPAVILDIDETVLDNSPYEARLIKNEASYNSESWAAWVKEAVAEPLPGAVNFTHFAKSLGVEVFYISNRRDELKEPTIRNLKAAGFANADADHVLLKTTSSDKTERRNLVKANHHVILMVGDQLTDFGEQYVLGSDTLLQHFVMLPNPMYGNFDDKILEGDHSLPEGKKIKLRKAALKEIP